MFIAIYFISFVGIRGRLRHHFCVEKAEHLQDNMKNNDWHYINYFELFGLF